MFVSKTQAFSKPKYINDLVIDVPNSALKALENELKNLFEKSHKAIYHAISLHQTDILKSEDLKKTIKKSTTKIETI